MKFRVGQKVRPSKVGIKANIFTRTRINQSGVVKKVDEFGSPTIVWDGQVTPNGYSQDFISPDRR